MVEPGSGKKWFRSFSEIVADIFLEEIENECNENDIKMIFSDRANEAESRMMTFARHLHRKYRA